MDAYQGKLSYAPWTKQQVDKLTAIQSRGVVAHPYVCPTHNTLLEVGVTGLKCTVCEYAQEWVLASSFNVAYIDDGFGGDM